MKGANVQRRSYFTREGHSCDPGECNAVLATEQSLSPTNEVSRMQIDKGASVAVVVSRNWANLHGVKMFLKQNERSQVDIRGVDESHILFAEIIDAADSIGVWIEVRMDKHNEDPAHGPVRMLIPWSQVLAIVVADQFSPAIRQEARRIGFTGEMEWE